MKQLNLVTSARDAALLELAERAVEHEAVLSALQEEQEKREAVLSALQEEREEREATHLLLQDMFEDLRAAKARNEVLEHSIAVLLWEREERRASGGGNAPASEAVAATSTQPTGFNMANVRQAIETAVQEAAGLPADECKKKIRALRLKWHPDKHEVLKEMANEVSKMINEAVEQYGAAAPVDA